MLTLGCYDLVDFGKCCNIDCLTGLCEYEYRLQNLLEGYGQDI